VCLQLVILDALAAFCSKVLLISSSVAVEIVTVSGNFLNMEVADWDKSDDFYFKMNFHMCLAWGKIINSIFSHKNSYVFNLCISFIF
jgi:hypothetical protein